MARILLADDHAVVRMAIRLLLERAGHEVVSEVSSGIDVVSAARQVSPDLIILDIGMPKLDGFDILNRLRLEENKFKVVIFSGLSGRQYASRCARAGAMGFVSKDSELTELLSVVQVVLSGYSLFPADEHSSVHITSHSTDAELLAKLSDRELTVLRYLANGRRVCDIAAELMISEKTASTYKTRIQVKLQLSNTVLLAEFAKRNNLN